MITVHIHTYDVLGNAQDGYDVNDTFHYGTYECDSEDALCADTVGFLNAHYFAKPVDAIALDEVSDNVDYLDIEVSRSDDARPICHLTVARDE